MADAQLEQKAGPGLTGPRFEKAAERVGANVCNSGDLLELDSAAEMATAIVIDDIDAFVAVGGGALAETEGSEGEQVTGFGQDAEGLHQEDHAGHSLCMEKTFE